VESISVLLVDDNIEFTEVLQESLRKDENWKVDSVPNGESALFFLKMHAPTVVVLDVRLPDMSGIQILEYIVSRHSTSETRVIMISGYGNADERLKCLDMGAADYLAKPFKARELIHHIKLVLGLNIAQKSVSVLGVFSHEELNIDFNACVLTLRGREVILSKMEWSLLRELASNAGNMVTYRQLLQKCWSSEYCDEKSLLQETIYRLRAKIEPEPGKSRYIVNVPGVGYRFQLN
jgi:two-component system, OmpR family, KDP operon response regulator KdpE